MKNRPVYILFCIAAAWLLCSCASRKTFTTNYYAENQQALNRIEQSYKRIYQKRHFSIEFTDRGFNDISLEIITDSLKYMYEFGITEPRLQDTLVKYGLPAAEVTELVMQMRSIRCIWINNLDYYVNSQKNSLVFMSIRNVAIRLPFTYEKYYILTFYAQPQYFDSEGRLLANRRVRRLRRINGDIFRRINDKVCYSISERFR